MDKTLRIWDRNHPGAQEMFAEVGRICSAWANVESGLGKLFACFASSDPPLGASVAFGSIVSMDVRMTQLRAVSYCYFNSTMTNPTPDLDQRLEQFKNFERVLKTIETANALRNRIVHGILVEVQNKKGKKLCIAPHAETIPNLFGSDGNLLRNSRYAYSLKDLRTYGDHFQNLSAYLIQLYFQRYEPTPFLDKSFLQGLPSL